MDDVTVLESVTPVNGASALIRLKSSLSSRSGLTEQTHSQNTRCSKDTVLATQPLSALFLSLELKDNLVAMFDFFLGFLMGCHLLVKRSVNSVWDLGSYHPVGEEASGSNCLNKKHCCP